MLQFAKRLASKGLKVTLASTMSITKLMHFGPGFVKVEPICDEEGAADFKHFFTHGSQMLANFIEKHECDSKDYFSCIIYDSVIPWALDVAKRLGLYGGPFFTQSCAVDAIYYLVHQGKLAAELVGTPVSASGLPHLGISDLPSFVSAPESYAVVLESLLEQFSNLEKADWVFVNSFEMLEGSKLDGGTFASKDDRPAVPSVYLDNLINGDNHCSVDLRDPNSYTCMKWLDARPIGSVVYVSFGSLAELEAMQMEELAWGLRGTNYYFLWVVRESEENKLPCKFVEERIEKGIVVSWCPQPEVLAHKAVGCFVTHCGWNSILEALSLGVPMVAMPQWSDQPTNAKYVGEVWGVGLKARVDEKKVVRKEEVERSIRAVMEGERAEEIKRNACKWRELAKEALEKGGSSDQNIEEFVDKLLSKI
ncbi:mogroside I-E synthase-like [Tasmannia lanceolata]|uniref:mogroside I-E synthase-like n=1 Tax=Tasmannia lanceolata TaxID=3420 RepID=UPI004063DA87